MAELGTCCWMENRPQAKTMYSMSVSVFGRTWISSFNKGSNLERVSISSIAPLSMWLETFLEQLGLSTVHLVQEL